ncbi:MAG: hypothetical protein CEE43_19395 [Promethearchaeota archaeon Loki_b32]|nr:MAG: hypothetical protein CEE43_19395 [Candidatus Lokiarchaeota archaeon Loki_b32]
MIDFPRFFKYSSLAVSSILHVNSNSELLFPFSVVEKMMSACNFLVLRMSPFLGGGNTGEGDSKEIMLTNKIY